MAERGLCLALEFRDNALGQHLAQFDASLVERVNVPDSALGKDGVLIEGNELAKCFRREPLGEDRVRRAVTLKDSVGHEPIRRALSFDLLGRLTEGQRFGLSEDVRQKHVMMSAERIERLVEGDEVTRDEPSPLMDQLIEGVLAVGSRLAPVDRSGVVVDVGPLERDMFAVTLHRQLLEIGWKAL